MTREEFQNQLNKRLASYEEKLKGIYICMYESRICGKSRCSAEHKTFAQLVKEFEADGNLYIRNRNEQGRFMKPIITDCDGNEISTDNPKGLTGMLDYDGDYRRFTCLSVYDAIHKGSGYEWHKALVNEINDDVCEYYTPAADYMRLLGLMHSESIEPSMVFDDLSSAYEDKDSDDEIAGWAISIAECYGTDAWDTYTTLNAMIEDVEERDSESHEIVIREWVNSIYRMMRCDPFKIYF